MLALLRWAVVGMVSYFVARMHLGLVNEAGSPDVGAPFNIEEPQIAQAIYGRLDAGQPVAHYSFKGEVRAQIRAIMLIPSSAYDAGLRAEFVLFGDGLPAQGLRPQTSERTMNIVGRDYVMTQSYNEPLAAANTYRVEVRRLEGEGAYCFCIGDQEGGHADAAMRARIDSLLDA